MGDLQSASKRSDESTVDMSSPRAIDDIGWIERAQFELEVGSVDDPAEAEADRIAHRVVRSIEAGSSANSGPGDDDDDLSVRRAVSAAGLNPGRAPVRHPGSATPRVRRSATGVIGREGGPADADLGDRIRHARGAGSPMPDPVRSTMERGFGADLSSVRFHTGGSVDALNDRLGARAFTVGSDVFFKGGVPDVGSSGGRRLIAHELAHTFQQGGARREPVRRLFGRSKKPGLDRAKVDEEIQAYFDAKSDELREYLGKLFGEKGMSWRRSKEARSWRQGIKDKAREQGRADVKTALDNYDPDADGNRKLLATEKEYYRIDAKKRVYSMAKGSVNEAVSQAVDKVFDQVWGPGKAVMPLAGAAKAQYLAMNSDDWAGALAAAKKEIDRLLVIAKTEGNEAKRIAFDKQNKQADGDRSASVSAAAAHMEKGTLESAAQQQVKDDDVGQKAVKQTIEADSVEAGMGVLGKLLDNVCGSSGDQVSLSIEFKVPVAQGLFLTFTLSGKAARGIDGAMTAGVPVFGDPRRLEVMGEFVFRFSAGVPDVWDLGVDLKLFARGGGNDTALCTKALSYGAYRRLGAIRKEMANWWAGAQKGTEEGKTLRAEAWAAMIEEQVFKERADGTEGGGFVDVGGGLGVSGEVGSREGLVGGFGGGLGASVFHRYDKDALKASLGDDFGSVVRDKAHAQERRDKVKGTYGASYSINGFAKFNIPGIGSVALAGSISGSCNKPASFGIEITGTMEYKGDSTTVIEKWAAGYATAAADIIKGFPKAVKPLFTDRVDAGVFAEAIAATTQGVNAGLENTVTNGLSNAYEVSRTAADGTTSMISGLGTSSSLQVALIGGCDGEKPIFRIEIRSGRKLEINTPMAGAAGVKISAEKTSRLLALGVDGGKVDAEIFGVRARGKTNQRGNTHRL